MKMSQLRKEDLSLYRYIKDTALRGFVEREEQVPLQVMESLTCNGSYVYQAMSTSLPSPKDRGRGWLFFDCPAYDSSADCVYLVDYCVPEFVTVSGTDASGTTCTGTPEQSNRVAIYDNDFVDITTVDYLIDYKDGRIILDTDLVIPKYVDYSWNYISVLDEWAAIEASEPPVVVIDMHGTDKEAYQLGAGKKIKRKVDLHIFASSPAERNDIVETLYDALYLKSAPIYDFPTGDVLDYDGTFYGRKNNPNKLTSLFNRTTLDNLGVVHGNMTFQKVSARNVNLPLVMSMNTNEIMLSDLNAYRSRISFEIETYTRI